MTRILLQINFNDEASTGNKDTNSKNEFTGFENADLPSEDDDFEGFVNNDSINIYDMFLGTLLLATNGILYRLLK